MSGTDQESVAEKTEEKNVLKEVTEAVADDSTPIDHKAPGVSFALVGITYFLVLALALAIGLIIWFL